jgi:nucleoside-diphosphate-sugar epimerase
MKAVVTGAGGFIGGFVVDRLLADGWAVTALDLPGRTAGIAPGATPLAADIRDPAALRAAFRGADVVFHVAALFDLLAPWSALHAVNLQGTRTVCAAARDAGVKRVVCWSSSSVYGVSRAAVPFTEEQPVDASRLNPYALSKYLAEEAALAAAGEDLEVVVIRPADVYGPGAVQGLAQALFAFKVGLMGAVPGPGTALHSHVHVADVAAAAIHLALGGKSGSVYNVADRGPIAVSELYALARRSIGAISVRDARVTLPAKPRLFGRPLFHVPAPVLRAFARWEVLRTRRGWLSAKLGPRPLASPEGVDLLLGHHIVSADRLFATGYRPLVPDVRAALPALVAACEQDGWGSFRALPAGAALPATAAA